MQPPAHDPRVAQALRTLPPPPRATRRKMSYGAGLWFGRLFIVPHTLVGVGLALYVLARVFVQLAGTPIVAVVDRASTTLSRKGRTVYNIDYHYVVDGQRVDGSKSATAISYPTEQPGARLPGRVAEFAGHPLLVLDHGGVGDTAMLIGAVIFWNGILSVFLFQFWVAPAIRRRLVESGSAAEGTLIDLTRSSGRGVTYRITYEFVPAGQRTAITAKQAVERSDYEWGRAGQPTIVFYRADAPQKSTPYEFSGYEIVGWRGLGR